MKLFHKIFLCFIVIFGITFYVVGYLLINFSYENAIEQGKQYAFQEFQYNKYILQSFLYLDSDFMEKENMGLEADAKQNFTVPVAIYKPDKECIYSDLETEPVLSDAEDANDDSIAYQVISSENKSVILVSDYVKQDDAEGYLVTQTDISSLVRTQDSMVSYFQKIYLIIICCAFPVIFILSGLLVRPIKRVSKATGRIAEGNYKDRIKVSGHDEVSELAANFNRMAEAVDEKVTELSDIAHQKEDFAANFAHELKTPLTSVIGYADMMYHKDLSREEVKSAAGYILSEGMRLEALALKLMDLFVMDRHDFVMEEMEVCELFEDLKQGIEPVCEKYGAKCHIDMDKGSIKADYDLFKTMILNLVDNAVKADSRDIWIMGESVEGEYIITIMDNGKGIPPDELGRITEAFYMVDKSRARKQHGAGLGMALVSKIVEICGAAMNIESDGHTGTNIRLVFAREGINDD